jgi:hypothetical protein
MINLKYEVVIISIDGASERTVNIKSICNDVETSCGLFAEPTSIPIFGKGTVFTCA